MDRNEKVYSEASRRPKEPYSESQLKGYFVEGGAELNSLKGINFPMRGMAFFDFVRSIKGSIYIRGPEKE